MTMINTVVSAMALRSQTKKEKDELLEWICPKDIKYITPKREKEVGNTFKWFLSSSKYLNWVDQDRSTMICSGKGIAFSRSSLNLC
jgi:hypothetical protein